jgi:hypothetical protein
MMVLLEVDWTATARQPYISAGYGVFLLLALQNVNEAVV